jgi:riboflavin synthase alpha subunit
MKKFVALTIFCAVFFASSSANAWFFFFLPGSVTSKIGDALTGSEGENCVGANAKVGDSINVNGTFMTVKSLSGTSSRCTNPAWPIRALLAAGTPPSSIPPASPFSSNESATADKDAAGKQQAEFERLDRVAKQKAAFEIDEMAAKAARAKSENEADAMTVSEKSKEQTAVVDAAAKTKIDAEAAANVKAEAEAAVKVAADATAAQQKGKSLETKLKELKLLYSKGLISKDVYEAKQRELLNAN